MTASVIANVLYHLSTDMDYADYEDTQLTEIAEMKSELINLGTNSTLYKAIEMIVEKEIK